MGIFWVGDPFFTKNHSKKYTKKEMEIYKECSKRSNFQRDPALLLQNRTKIWSKYANKCVASDLKVKQKRA